MIQIGPLIVSHRSRDTNRALDCITLIQIVPLIVSHRSRDTNKALTICKKLQIILFAPGPNGLEFSLRRKSDNYLGRLSWGTQLTRTFLVKYLGKLSWETLSEHYIEKLSWEAILGSSLDIHTSDKKTTSVMQFPPGNRITLVSPSVFDIHTRDNTSFVFWQIVKPTRFVSISFHKKKGGDVI